MLLVFITVVGMLASLSMLPVFAEDATTEGGTENDDGTKETVELSAEDRYKKYYLEGKEYDDEGNEIFGFEVTNDSVNAANNRTEKKLDNDFSELGECFVSSGKGLFLCHFEFLL